MALESFPPGFFLKKKDVKILEEEAPEEVEESPEAEQSVEQDPAPADPEIPEEDTDAPEEDTANEEDEAEEEEPPYVPSTPYNVKVTLNEKEAIVFLDWDFDDELLDIEFMVFLNDKPHVLVAGDTEVEIKDLPVNETYKVLIQATHKPTDATSAVSDPVHFELLPPVTVDNADYWIPCKINKLSVSYQK